jgi:hypothetical protein
MREVNACQGMRTSTRLIRVRSRGMESKAKFFEPVQRGQACDHRFRRNVTGLRNIPEVKVNKVIGRQKQFSYYWKWDAM